MFTSGASSCGRSSKQLCKQDFWISRLAFYRYFFLQEWIPSNFYDEGHSASTYLAQCILRILGDNLSCVEAEAILSTVHDPQQPDGR